MVRTRTFVTLSVAVLVAFLILTAFYAVQESRRTREFIRDHELPSLGLAVLANLDRTAAQYHQAGDELLRYHFIRDWILAGEQDEDALREFLETVRREHRMLDAGIVSDRTETYYGTDGRTLVLNPDDFERDGWYYLYRDSVPETNIDAWYFPETGEIGMWVNVPIYGPDGEFLGVTGGGVDASDFGEMLEHYGSFTGINIYMARRDGRLVFASDQRLLQPPAVTLAEIWGRDVIPELVAARDSGRSLTLQPDGARGPVLWGHYSRNWDTFVIVEKGAAVLTERARTSVLKSMLPALFLTASLYAITLGTILYARRRITVQARLLEALAGTDQLTGLHNRTRFNEIVQQETQRVQRTGEESCLVILDLDLFKEVNDTYGHPNGDRVLKTVATVIKTELRSTDTLARFGGEEFTILLPGTSVEGAYHVAEKVRRAIEARRFPEPMTDLVLTASIGVAPLHARTNRDFDTTYREADRALYRAKDRGRNRTEALTEELLNAISAETDQANRSTFIEEAT